MKKAHNTFTQAVAIYGSDIYLYTTMLDLAARFKNKELAQKIWKDLKDKGEYYLDAQCYVSMMLVMAACNDYNQTIEISQEAIKRWPKDIRFYNQKIKACRQLSTPQSLKIAYDTFQTVIALDNIAHFETYLIMLDTLGVLGLHIELRDRCIKCALSIFQQMQRAGIFHINSYIQMIRTLGYLDRRLAYNIYEEAIQKFSTESTLCKEIILDMISKSDQLSSMLARVEKLFSQAKKDSLLSHKIYAYTIDCYFKSGDIERALELFTESTLQGLIKSIRGHREKTKIDLHHCLSEITTFMALQHYAFEPCKTYDVIIGPSYYPILEESKENFILLGVKRFKEAVLQSETGEFKTDSNFNHEQCIIQFRPNSGLHPAAVSTSEHINADSKNPPIVQKTLYSELFTKNTNASASHASLTQPQPTLPMSSATSDERGWQVVNRKKR